MGEFNSRVRWEFGTCKSPAGNMQRQRIYYQKCCIGKENATLKCESEYGFGGDFGGGRIEINGHRFCDVFYSTARIRLNIKGKKLLISLCLIYFYKIIFFYFSTGCYEIFVSQIIITSN